MTFFYLQTWYFKKTPKISEKIRFFVADFFEFKNLFKFWELQDFVWKWKKIVLNA